MSRFSGLNLRKISINTVFQFLVRIIGSVSTLIVTLLITYFLGLDAFGSFTKVVAFVSLFYVLIDFGLNSIVLKQYFKKVEDQLANLVTLRLIIALVLLPVIFITSLLLPYNEIAGTGFSGMEKGAIMIFSLTLIALAINNTLLALLQRKLTYSYLLVPSFVSNIILVAIVLFAVVVGNFYLLLLSYVISGTIMAVLTYIKVKSEYKFKLNLSKFSLFSKEVLKTSWPLGLMLVFNLLYTKTDIFLLSLFKSSQDVGTYGISYRFFEIALALPTFLSNSTYPILLESKKKKKYVVIILRYLKLYILLSGLVMFSILFFAPIINLLGSQFSNSIFPLQILALSLPFFFATSLLQWHFLIRGKLIFLVPLYFSALVLNILFNIKFIPEFSYLASAVITVLSEGLVFAVMLWYFIYDKKRVGAKN